VSEYTRRTIAVFDVTPQNEVGRYKAVNDEVNESMEKIQLQANKVLRERAEFARTVARSREELQKVRGDDNCGVLRFGG